MTTPTKEKLQHALSGARQMLGRKGVEGGISKSRLNQLRGIGAAEDTRHGDLLSRTNVSQRPVFDLVANKILGLQQEVRGVVNLDLQKPYATAQGDQVLIFKRNQENLISILNKYSLPNTSCPLLVRDNETKEFLKTKLSKSNIAS